jgi:hypothetical protein
MTETKSATPAAATAEPPKTLMQKLNRWGLIAAAIILGLISLLKIYNAFAPQLPRCGSDDVATLIRDIFKKKDRADRAQRHQDGVRRFCATRLHGAYRNAVGEGDGVPPDHHAGQ